MSISIAVGYKGSFAPEEISVDDDQVEIDVIDNETAKSLFGDEHITVAEMVRRVQLHGELVRACIDVMSKVDDAAAGRINWRGDFADRVRATLAKVKP